MRVYGCNILCLQISSSYHWQSSAAMLRMGEDSGPHAANSQVRDRFQRELAYANSKLAQVYHARALAKRCKTQKVKFISACPAWVGTNIAPEGLARRGLALLAFSPNQGIYSALSSMFRPEIESGDFVGNSNLISNLPPVTWVITSNFASVQFPQVRKVLTDAFAGLLLVQQKYDFSYHVQRSSPESYDEAVGDALHEWSLKKLSDWL